MQRRTFFRQLASHSVAAGALVTGSASRAEAAKLGLGNVCFITDEYSRNLDEALAFGREFGVRQAEIRNVDGKYCFLHDAAKLREIRSKLDAADTRVAILSTPIMKCIAPGFEVSAEAEREIALAAPGFPIPNDEQFPRIGEFMNRAIEAAKILGTDKIRVFGFWRVVNPPAVNGLILEKLEEVAALAGQAGMTLCIENETACNLATCAETAAVLAKAPANVGMIWDPRNAAIRGETAYSHGYSLLDKKKIHHLHLKDMQHDGAPGKYKVVAVGDGLLPYPEIFKALAKDGYQGALSMETHFALNGSKEEASRRSMRGILKALAV
jgi:sugar phosphate isomerase/epimerase